MKSFMKPEYPVIQSSDMTHPQKWAIADEATGRGHRIMFDIITVQKWVKKNNKVKVLSTLYIFVILCLLFNQSHIGSRFKIFI